VGQAVTEQKMPQNEVKLQSINDFLFDAHLDNLNLFKVLKYCKRSKISMKVRRASV
jgi:chromosome transmission fidelity protein 1